MTSSEIVCRDVCFQYPRGATALEGIDLVAPQASFVSLIGPSGCGKSTLLRLVADLLQPTRGTVTVGGEAPRVARSARGIGMVFQEPALLPWRRALRNVDLPVEIAGRRDAASRARSRQWLARLGLHDMGQRLPAQMSGGQRQRVALARAFMQEPNVLLMDEPFGALDQITRDDMNAVLLDVWEDAKPTVLFVTHSIAEAVYLSDHVVVFTPRPGRIRVVIPVDLPRPRRPEMRREHTFFDLENRVLAALDGRLDEAGARAASR